MGGGILHLGCAALLGTAVALAAAPAGAQDFIFYDFACKDMVRHKDVLTRTTTTTTGPVTHTFKCIDHSCFYWGVLNPGAENEVQVVEHILIDDEEKAFTFSLMTWKAGDDAPSYRYSRVKQLLDCISPAPAE